MKNSIQFIYKKYKIYVYDDSYIIYIIITRNLKLNSIIVTSFTILFLRQNVGRYYVNILMLNFTILLKFKECKIQYFIIH